MRKFLSNLARAVAEVSLPLWIRRKPSLEGVKLSGDERGVVVSLTSFPARIGKVWITLESLFRQTRRPDRIVLTLTEEEFPGGINDLPESLAPYIARGVEVVFLPYNLKCHNKYCHSLVAFPDAVVITVDDDCYYRSDTVERLLALHRKYPGAVCCNIAVVIDPSHFHEYSFWKKSSEESGPSSLNVALGFAGVLYPSGLPLDRILDRKTAGRLAPTADDLWLKAVEMASGIGVACGGFFPKPLTIKSSQVVSLRSKNKGPENRNDLQWTALDEYFGLSKIIS